MKYLFIVLASILALPVFSQHTVSGVIQDAETKETLVGSTVYFPDLFKGATTDLQGKYIIKDIPTGSFNIEFSFVGYKTVIQHVHIVNDTTINIALNPDLKEMKEVIVTGVAKSTELRISPIPAVIASRKQLFEVPSTNLIDGLTQQPGIEQITTGPAISKPIIRGLGYNRVLTLYNGLRQEGQQWGDEHGIEIDEFSIDKVEIIKGPGSIAYGSDAMAGVINFLTPHETEEGKINGSVDAGYQTNNNQYHISGATSGNINGINWRGRITGKQAGNYQNSYDGKVFNSGFNELDWDAQMGVNKSWGFSHVYVSNFDQHIGLVEGDRDANGNFTKLALDNNGQPIEQTAGPADLNGYGLSIPQQRVRHFRLGTSNMFYFNQSSLMLKLDYQLNQREEFGDITAPDAQELYFKLKSYNYSIKYFLRELNHWQTSIGINGMYQQNANLGLEVLIPEYNMFDAGAYILTQKEFAKVMVSGGFRFDNRYINSKQLILNETGTPEEKFSAFTKLYHNFSGSVGVSFRPGGPWNFKLNLARGYRAPTLAELSSNGIHEGSFRYEYGNINLKPETSLQSDLGIELETSHSTIELAAFYNHIDHYIYVHKLQDAAGNDSIPDPADGSFAYQYVQNSANVFGGEAGIDIHPHPFNWLHFENTFSIVYARQTNQPDSLTNLPFIPAPKFKSELRANISNQGKTLTNNFIKLEWLHYFTQDRIFSAFATETATPAYSLLNAGIGTTIKNANGLSLFNIVFLANNLLDVSYQNHLSRLKYAPENVVTGRIGVYNMGRNFMIKVRVPLKFK